MGFREIVNFMELPSLEATRFFVFEFGFNFTSLFTPIPFCFFDSSFEKNPLPVRDLFSPIKNSEHWNG